MIVPKIKKLIYLEVNEEELLDFRRLLHTDEPLLDKEQREMKFHS